MLLKSSLQTPNDTIGNKANELPKLAGRVLREYFPNFQLGLPDFWILKKKKAKVQSNPLSNVKDNAALVRGVVIIV